MLELGVELIFELIAWATGTRTLRAAPLDHKISNHAVERQSIIKPFASQLFEVGDRFGCLVVEQFEADFTLISGHRGNFHGSKLSIVYEVKVGAVARIASGAILKDCSLNRVLQAPGGENGEVPNDESTKKA